jgi:hypothetical protein
MKFTATVLQSGRTATGVAVPDSVVEGLGGGGRPAVVVRIGDYGYRTSVGRMSGTYMLPISAEHRAGAGIAAGDEIDVDLELDTEPRVVTVPDDLAAALGSAGLRETFDALSYSHQLRHVLAVEGAKAAETRARRVAGVVAALG